MADTVRTKAQLLALFPDNNRGLISAQDARDLIVSIPTKAEADTFYSPLIHTHTDLELNTLGLAFFNQTFATSNNNPANVFCYRVDASSGSTTVKLPTVGDTHKRTYVITKIDSTANVVNVTGSAVAPIVTLDGATTFSLSSQWETIIVTGVGSATSTAYSSVFKSKMTNTYLPLSGGGTVVGNLTLTGQLTFSPANAYSITGVYQVAASFLSGNGAGITALNASNITTGTLSAAVFTDTSHGTRGGGTLHTVASQTAAGFMSAQDKIALDNGFGNSVNKADKVAGAVSGHLAALDSTGNLQDAGYAISGLSLATGTYSTKFQLDIGSSGPLFKNVTGAVQIRNGSDTGFADVYASNFFGSGFNLTNLNAGNIGSGTIPAGHISDASHGNRGGGSLHALVTTSTPGFMSAEDKAILDQIVTNGLPNNGGGGISNVTITNPVDRDVIIYNQGSSTFINRHLTYADVLPNFLATGFTVSSVSIVEAGTTITNPTWTASYNINNIASATITDDGGGSQIAATAPYTSGTLTGNSYVKSVHGNKVTWTLTATPQVGYGSNQILTYQTSWNVKRYWGVAAAGGNTDTFIKALPSSDLIDARKISFVANAGVGQKIYYACKTSFGTPNFYMGGINGGFSLVSNSISVTNGLGVTDVYQLWATNQVSLGTVEVDVDTDNEVGATTQLLASHAQNTDSGTTSSSFQIDMLQAGPRIKNAASIMQVRDALDSTLAPLAAASITGGTSTDNAQLTGLGLDRVGVSTDLPLVLRPKNAGALQTASTGNNRGNYAVDLQRSRLMNVQVSSGDYSVITGGQNNQNMGLNGVIAGGKGNIQTAESGSILGGVGARQDFYGGMAHASGFFTVVGDAQIVQAISRCITTNAVATELFLDNNSLRLVMPANTTWHFTTKFVGRRTDGTTDCAGFIFSGIVGRDDAASTVAFYDAVEKTVYNNSTGNWDAAVYVDTSSGSLSFSATGDLNNIVRWVAFTQIVQVSNG